LGLTSSFFFIMLRFAILKRSTANQSRALWAETWAETCAVDFVRCQEVSPFPFNTDREK